MKNAPRPTPASAPPLTAGRRRLFVALTLAFPVIVLALLEGGLRLGGYGQSYPLFVPYPGHPELLGQNPEFARRYFGSGPFAPTPELDGFRVEKRPGAFRVFVQGESSAKGFPYGHGAAPSRILAALLQDAFPTTELEVVNTALTAVNSYTLLDQADEIIAQHPDAIVIYTGHNEYYGALGAGAARGLGRSHRVVAAYLALRHLRTVQLIAAALGTGAGPARGTTPGGADAPRSVMELMAGGQLVPLGSDAYQRGIEQFQANLGALLERYHAHGIAVYIGTLASNERDQPPFVSLYAPGADSVAAMRARAAALAALTAGDTAAALRAFETAVRVDSTAAAPWFLLASLRDARGDTLGARAAYRRAKDADQLRFRAPEALNAVIRAEAALHGAVLVETEAALERASPRGIVGRSLMLEHLHPNVDGYFVIAEAFAAAMRARAAIGPWPAPEPAASARRRVAVTAVDSLGAVYRVDRLTSGWPFRPRGTIVVPVVDTLHPRTPAERLAQAFVRGEMTWPEATERLRAEYERAGDVDHAIGAALAMAQEYRYSSQPYLDAARIAAGAHRDDEALGYVRAAAAREETPNSVELLGLMLLKRGDTDAALQQLERAAHLAPGDRRMTEPLAAARALPALERARRAAPRDTVVLYQTAVAYAVTQQFARTREALDALLLVAPANARARDLLRQLPQ